MTTLLTGATGLVGANLAHLLCARGERPRLLVRERSDRRGLRGLAFDEARGDLLDRPSLEAALRGVSRVFHAAGVVRFDARGREALLRVHVDGTRHLLEAARAAGVRRVVLVSSAAAVGHGPLSDPATEDTPFNFDGNRPYHQAKRQAEELALSFNRPGFAVLAANPSLVLGPYDVRPTSGRLLLLVARGLARAYPSGGANVVDARDVADGLARVMEQGRPGERYLLGGENLTYRALLTLVAEEAGVAPPRVPVPDRLLGLSGRLGDLLGPLSPALRPFLNPELVRELGMPSYVSHARATRELGYRPRPVRLAIREALRWFQEEGYLPRDHALTPRAAAGA